MNTKVLVINAGSSSIKWQIFSKNQLQLIASGLVERIGITGGLFKVVGPTGSTQINFEVANHKAAVEKLIELWSGHQIVDSIDEIEIAGFRVVHGGSIFRGPVKLDETAIGHIQALAKFAPLHNPSAIESIRAIQAVLPNVKLAASFDTAFHADIPKINYTYPISSELSEKYQIRKYGFHGISHKYITNTLEQTLGVATVDYVNMHIGNGASLAAIKDSKSIDTSMGLTPLAGLMMGTRSGDIDPSIHHFVYHQAGISIDEFTDILNKKSGVLGVSGISSDMRDLSQAAKDGNAQAEFTLELYAQKIADYLVNYINKVGKSIQALVFTGGVGENSASMRQRIIDKINLPKLNLVLNQTKNTAPLKDFGPVELVSDASSDLPIYVIKTNEELLIAQNAIKSWK